MFGLKTGVVQTGEKSIAFCIWVQKEVELLQSLF